MSSKNIFRSIFVSLVFVSAHAVTTAQSPVSGHGKINFTNFTVNSKPKGIMIDWATDNKVPTNYFEIERSSDGVNFKTIAMVLGPDPKQANCDCYECFDKTGSKAKYFYRLKHVGTDGEVELSETKMLAVNN